MAGDVHVRIFIEKHKDFTRNGADLFVEKHITLLEALTGTNYEIKHLDGSIFKVNKSIRLQHYQEMLFNIKK
jgi:DnaJ-class molecular chaperone